MNGYDVIAEKIEKGEALDKNETKLTIMCIKFMKNCRYEHVPDVPFICGEGGSNDESGMPEYFFICPTYGVDWSTRYKREKSSGPEY